MTEENIVLLNIQGLKTSFYIDEGIAHAVDDVSLILRKGETLGIVGESGCGKSVTALSIMRLIPQPPGRIVSGSIYFDRHEDLLKLSETEMQEIRGKDISMIFQEPMTSLNPILRVGNQVAESIYIHQKVTKKEALERAIEELKKVGIPDPAKRSRCYPHEMSGGMRQRVMIAMALSCNPKLMLADEPTTALDVTIQAQILSLMEELKDRMGTSIILITHNLGVVAEMCQNVCVMYAGVVMEYADVENLYSEPLHPYSNGLLDSIPRIDCLADQERKRLTTIPGLVPSVVDLPDGCKFQDRCRYVQELCRKEEPPLFCVSRLSAKKHQVRCWLFRENTYDL